MPARRKFWCFISTLLLGLVSTTGHAIELQAVVVAVNPKVVIETLSRNELRAIFAMRRRVWPDGTPIRVFVLPDDHPFHWTFCKKILRVYPYQLRRIWDRNVFSGTGPAPVEVETLGEMHRRISEVSGAIGYLSPEWVDSRVKIVEVH